MRTGHLHDFLTMEYVVNELSWEVQRTTVSPSRARDVMDLQ